MSDTSKPAESFATLLSEMAPTDEGLVLASLLLHGAVMLQRRTDGSVRVVPFEEYMEGSA